MKNIMKAMIGTMVACAFGWWLATLVSDIMESRQPRVVIKGYEDGYTAAMNEVGKAIAKKQFYTGRTIDMRGTTVTNSVFINCEIITSETKYP